MKQLAAVTGLFTGMLPLYIILLLSMPAQAPAQGCSMCRETASFQKERAVGALQRGILLLGIPPLAIAGGIAWTTYRRSKQFNNKQKGVPPPWGGE